jgi:hypothetical protein
VCTSVIKRKRLRGSTRSTLADYLPELFVISFRLRPVCPPRLYTRRRVTHASRLARLALISPPVGIGCTSFTIKHIISYPMGFPSIAAAKRLGPLPSEFASHTFLTVPHCPGQHLFWRVSFPGAPRRKVHQEPAVFFASVVSGCITLRHPSKLTRSRKRITNRVGIHSLDQV